MPPGLFPGGMVRLVPGRAEPLVQDRVSYRPGPPLNGHVLAYIGIPRNGRPPAVMRVVPIGSVLLKLEFDPAPGQLVTGDHRIQLPVQPVVGLHDRPVIVEPSPPKGLVIVVLTPMAAHAICDVALRDLANSFTGFTHVLGHQAGLLMEQLAAAQDWPSRFALLDKQLTAWLERGKAPTPVIARAWQRLHTSGGQLRIDDLAAEIGTSRRYLEMRFAEQVGLAPKTVARIARFHDAARIISTQPRPDLAGLAFGCGYSDHAHMDREFKDISGCTPTELLSQMTLGAVNGVTSAAETSLSMPDRPGTFETRGLGRLDSGTRQAAHEQRGGGLDVLVELARGRLGAEHRQ
jgi:AraC-like DNA-binding protein